MINAEPSRDALVGDIGETAALAMLLPLLPSGDQTVVGPGDDCAVLQVSDPSLLISTDMMVEGPDFRFLWSRPSDIGFKAVASNAADIAAMGGVVVGFTIAVAVPANTPLRMLIGLAEGVAEGISTLTPGAGVIGGDLSRSEVFTLTITVFGTMNGHTPVLRSGACPGDLVCVAGELGLSRVGLQKLVGAKEDELAIAGLVQRDKAVAHHLRPRPPLAEGPLAAHAGATAMLDISDGLVLDASRIARASGVRLEFDESAGLDDDALHGGEDHGLLATFPPDKPIPGSFRKIGVVVAGDPGVFLGSRELDPQSGGWDPFTALAQ